MPVTSLKPYVGVSRDRVENYDGQQLVYASWDHHLLLASPSILCVSPQMTFGDLVEQRLKPLVQADPDASSVDWRAVHWLKGNQPFEPTFDRTLAENGIEHKAQIRWRTPGLNSLMPAAR